MTEAVASIENNHSRQHTDAGGSFMLAFGLLAYLSFLAAFLYAIGFVGNWIVPKSIDSGPTTTVAISLLINALLLGIFALQHTIMARPAFKRWWTSMVPKSAERSIFVLLASASLGLTFWQWRPLPHEIWHVTGPVATFLNALSLAGWAIVFVASFTINHFDLFGLRQTWFRFQNKTYSPVGFRLAGFYRIVRHPLMLGFIIAFWVTPVMTVGHLFFAAMTTAYIRFGVWIEERDLIAEHGERYLDYARRVRGLIPLPKNPSGITKS